jgi:hypothetical protein
MLEKAESVYKKYLKTFFTNNIQMKANYNAIKPTKRQKAKQRKLQNDNITNTNMICFLQSKWKTNDIKYTCANCLQIAYQSEIDNCQGYVTDDELIESSNGILKHK